jgi:hypothetical protein
MRRMNSGTGWRFTSRSRPAQLAEGTAQHDDRHDGGAQYQFVARRAGAADTLAMHVRAQATFPLMRFQDLSDEHQPNGFAGIAHQRLEDLDRLLRDDGGRRCEEPGRHRWARTYEATH